MSSSCHGIEGRLDRIVTRRNLRWGALVAVLLVSTSGCKKSEPGGPPMGAMPPPEVTAVVVQPRDVPVSFEYPGQVAGVREVEVRARVSGILERWNFTEGGHVSAGQSLFLIDPAPFRAALAKAEAELAGAQARVQQAERTVGRLKALWEAKMVSQKDYDDATSAVEVTAAAVKSAQASVTEARLNLAYTRVEAPISGIASRAVQSEGSLVQAQQTLLTTISQVDNVYVIFGFSEAEHLKFTRAMTDSSLRLPKDGHFDVAVKLADGTEYARPGKVNFTDVRVDPATGTIEARALLPNPQRVLRPGQFVRVRLSGGMRPGAIAIPQRAVLEGPGSKIVLTVNAQGIVEPRPVQVGDWSGEDWIILGGLKAGDQVIVDGVVKARPGSPVKVSPPAAAAAPAKPAPAEAGAAAQPSK
jgi:membrane fusion protein (multidrug efflux system)